jgi:signal transduction histidine kinase
MLDRIRWRLTIGYVGILALILVLFGAIVVVSFSRQVTAQQDELLEQKARAEANGPLYNGDEYGLIKATTDSDIAVVAILPDGSMDDVLDLNPSARSSLGLPFAELAREAGREGRVISETVDGPDGPVRVVSVPLFDETGEVVDVIQAAQLRRVVWETVNRLVFVLVPVGIGALLLATIGGLYVSGRAMQPVRDSFQRQRTFIADASHELKTPLTLIRADAEVLSRGLTDPDHRQLANDLLAETDRMNALLSDLLTLARLDAGKLAVEQRPFDLAAAIAETAERFGVRAVAEEVRLKVDAPDKLFAHGDPERTAQILAALLDNALRFTPSGGAVEIAARAQDGRVEASVADTGPGISPEHLPHVFDRFYRVEAARTRAGGGTGLGLAIARELARAQGGELAVGNGQNGGASFTLRLPAGS